MNLNFPSSTVTFILCGKGFYFLSFGIIPFSHVYTTSKPPWYRYFAGKLFGFKVFHQIGSYQYSQLDEKKKCFAWKNAKEVVRRLGTGWFVIVTNSALHPHGEREGGGGEISEGKFLQEQFSNNAGFDASRNRSEKTFCVSRFWPT